MICPFQKIFFLFCMALSWIVCGEQSDIYEKLCRSLTFSRQTSFACEIADRNLLDSYGCESGRFFHVYENGNHYAKMILYNRAKEEQCVFLNNEEGGFAWAGNQWAKIAELFPLHYYENIWEPFPEAELEFTEFSERFVFMDGKKYLEITASTNASGKQLCNLNPEVPFWGMPGSYDISSPLYERRPIKTVYLIDTLTHFVYSKRCYNVNGKQVYHRRIKGPDFSVTTLSEDFSSPDSVKEEYLYLHDGFLSDFYQELFRSSQPAHKRSYTTKKQFIQRMKFLLFNGKNIYWISIALICISLACFGSVNYMKRHWR